MTDFQISKAEAQTDLLAAAAYLAEHCGSGDGYAAAIKHLVPLYLAQDKVDLAAEFANGIDDPFDRENTMAKVIIKCAELDDDEYAFQLADVLENPTSRDAANQSIAIVKALQGKFPEALKIARMLKHPDEALKQIAVEMNVRGDETQAKELIAEIEDSRSQTEILTRAALHFIEQDNKEKAFALLEEAKNAAENIDYPTERLRALHAVSYGFHQAGRADRSIETLSEMQGEAENIQSFDREPRLSEISLAFFEVGSIDLADRALDGIKDKTLTADVLAGYAREYWKRGENEDALEALREASEVLASQHEKETRDSAASFKLSSGLAAMFAEFGETETAINAADRIIYEPERVNALIRIAQHAAAQDKSEAVRQILRIIGDDSDRLTALVLVADAETEKNRREDALNFLTEAHQLAETVPQLSVRSNIFNRLAERFAKLDENETAHQIVSENLQIVAQIRDQSVRAITLADLAETAKTTNFTLNQPDSTLLRTILEAVS